MSGENITILEGGKAENFGQVTKLKTSNGSGHDLWVPKTDVKTGHLSVKKNGLYYTNQYEPTASEKKDGHAYDIYGWDTITVSVKKKVKGKKKKRSPKTGLEYDAPTSVDVDDDGNLIETELPVYIEIEQPPDKLEYRDGESISKAGMVVKAYYADDREWGTVPNSETTLDPSTAQGDSDQKEYDKDGVHAIGFLCSIYNAHNRVQGYHANIPFQVREVSGGTLYSFFYRATVGYAYFTKYNGRVYYASFDASMVGPTYATFNSDGEGWYGTDNLGGTVSTNGQFRGSFTSIEWNPFFLALIPESEVDPTLVPAEGGGTSDQTITVGWTPPDGEEELTDTFDITVIPSN